MGNLCFRPHRPDHNGPKIYGEGPEEEDAAAEEPQAVLGAISALCKPAATSTVSRSPQRTHAAVLVQVEVHHRLGPGALVQATGMKGKQVAPGGGLRAQVALQNELAMSMEGSRTNLPETVGPGRGNRDVQAGFKPKYACAYLLLASLQ